MATLTGPTNQNPLNALDDPARDFVSGAHRLIVGAQRPEATDGRTLATLDPATGLEIAQVPHAGAQDVDAAVAAAREAFEGPWSSLAPAARGQLIAKLADAVEAHARGTGADRVAGQRQAGEARAVRGRAGAPSRTCATSRAGRARSRAACCR